MTFSLRRKVLSPISLPPDLIDRRSFAAFVYLKLSSKTNHFTVQLLKIFEKIETRTS